MSSTYGKQAWLLPSISLLSFVARGQLCTSTFVRGRVHVSALPFLTLQIVFQVVAILSNRKQSVKALSCPTCVTRAMGTHVCLTKHARIFFSVFSCCCFCFVCFLFFFSVAHRKRPGEGGTPIFLTHGQRPFANMEPGV